MNSKNLYQRIEDEKVTDLSRDLFYQICMKSHVNHTMLQIQTKLKGFVEYPEIFEINEQTTYRELKEKFPKYFDDQIDMIAECIKAGYKI